MLLVCNACTLPLVGQFFAHLNALEALVYPLVGIPETLVVQHRLLDRQLRVLQLVYALRCHLRHPYLEGLSLGGRYGLNNTEKLLSISYICHTHLAVCGLHFQLTTICSRFKSFFLRRTLRTLRYFLALSVVGWSVSTPITSTIEKYHFSCSASHTVRTFLSSNS